MFPKTDYTHRVKVYVWVLVPFWVLLLFAVGHALYSLFLEHFEGCEISSADLRWRYLSITAMIATLGAIIAAPFTVIRVFVNERQTKTAEEGLTTDRITKATEQLSADKTVIVQVEKHLSMEGKAFSDQIIEERIEPNLEARIGALYALERLGRDEPEVRLEVLKQISSYIRLNGKREVYPFPQTEWMPGDDKKIEVINSLPVLWPDLQAAIEVIGRLLKRDDLPKSDREFQVDLRDANLVRADVNGLWIRNARLHGADLRGTICRNTDFGGANLSGADLSWSNLSLTNLSHVTVEETDFREADLKGARVRGVDLSKAKNLTQAQLNSLFGDKATKLPDGLARTTELNHEPQEKPWHEDSEFQRWKAAGYPEGVLC